MTIGTVRIETNTTMSFGQVRFVTTMTFHGDEALRMEFDMIGTLLNPGGEDQTLLTLRSEPVAHDPERGGYNSDVEASASLPPWLIKPLLKRIEAMTKAAAQVSNWAVEFAEDDDEVSHA